MWTMMKTKTIIRHFKNKKNVLLRCVALLAAAGLSIPLILPVGLEKRLPGDQFLSL